ncbi:MAG: MBL fold metallo-hydrolase [Bacteroidota bacterium]|nr:MBL fold metallo-hydrolase [Bacteroidota bacterium]
MKSRLKYVVLISLATISFSLNAQIGNYSNSNDGLKVKVLDVGQALSVVIRTPNKRYVLYDTGKRDGIKEILKTIPKGDSIDLMILSHTDEDHVGSAADVIANYPVKRVINAGYIFQNSITKTYQGFLERIGRNKQISNINLFERDSAIIPGTSEQYGDLKIIYLCGFGKPLEEWGLNGKRAESINSVSIVIKLEYMGKSILICGDALGRTLSSGKSQLIATEKYLINKANSYLRSDVIIAPHHGANNASSDELIDSVKPKYVIFSSGHSAKLMHPRATTAERYLRKVSLDHIFRTDLGDDDGIQEWDFGRERGIIDGCGDHNVEIDISNKSDLTVCYYSSN